MRHNAILVIGATGELGLAAVHALSDQGWAVRALTREPTSSRAIALAKLGAEVVGGDLGDGASLKAAMAGLHGVFCVAPMLASLSPTATFEFQLECVTRAIDVAEDAGVSHFVLTSASGADQGVNANRQTKWMMETHLRSTKLASTVLRPVSFMENFALPRWGLHQGLFTTPLAPATRQQLIAADDIAAFAAIAFARPDTFASRTLEIAGDDLTPVVMASTLSAAVGRRIPYLEITGSPLKRINPGLAADAAKLNAGERTAIDIGALRKIHPRLMSFEAWLAQVGAERLKKLLPSTREGLLAELPAWRLESLSGARRRPEAPIG